MGLLLNKEAFHAYYEYLDKPYIKENYRELFYIYSALEEAHSIIEGDLPLPSLQAYFFQKYPDVDKDIYLGLFKTIAETTIDATLGTAMLGQIKSRKQALRLSEAYFKFSNGNITYDQLCDARTKGSLDDTTGEGSRFDFVTTKLSTLIHDIFEKSGLRWRLDALNKSLGSLRKSNFGFIFARPETGKTTFLASEITYMLTQLKDEDGSIIWFNNEQAGKEVMLRIYQAYFGLRLDQLRSNITKYEEQFEQQTKGKFLLVDDANLEKAKVEKLIKRFNSSLIVFDQIDKLKGFAADREDLRLGAIYIWAREIAKEYCPVIGVCQADGTAEGQKWLTMDNVANAKTSKQAEADWILGMGMAHGEGLAFIRYLNISKNKLMGDEDSLPKLRHGRFEVLIEPEIARFRDIIKYA